MLIDAVQFFGPQGVGEVGRPPAASSREVNVMIVARVQLWSVSAIRVANVTLQCDGQRVSRAVISFQRVFVSQRLQSMPGGVFDEDLRNAGVASIWENLWCVRIGAVPSTGGAVQLFTRVIPGNFKLRPEATVGSTANEFPRTMPRPRACSSIAARPTVTNMGRAFV